MKKIGYLIIASTAILYVVVLFLFYIGQRRFIYFPPTDPVPTDFSARTGMDLVDIRTLATTGSTKFGTERVTTSIYMGPPNDTAPVILFFHGNGSAAYQYADLLKMYKSWGAGALAVEYPGYAANAGKPNEGDILQTALANYDALITLGIRPERIVLYGDSLGAAVAVHVAHEREAAGLMLSAPFLSMPEMAQKQMPVLNIIFPTSLLMKDTYRSDIKMPHVDEPLLIVHGDADQLIPYHQSQTLFALHTGEKQYILIKDGHHALWNTELPEHLKQAVGRFTQTQPQTQ